MTQRTFIITFAFLFLAVIHFGYGQEDKFKKDTITIKNPNKDGKDGKNGTIKDAKKDTANKEAKPFSPNKKPTLIQERDEDLNNEIISIVQVSDYLKIDCVWVKAASYYSVWSSQYINPYGKDPSKFRDTLRLEMYNEELGHLWSKPLADILMTSTFGYRWGGFHGGIDLNLRMGTPVYAIFDGIVRMGGWGNDGYGNKVVLRHYNGIETLYGHLSQVVCKVGQVVKAGEIIGLGGSTGWSTGPHLHLETRYAGNTFNPIYLFEFNSKTELPFVRTQYFNLMPLHFRQYGTQIRSEYTHTVKAGETINTIAARYGIKPQDLKLKNKLNSDIIRIGQILRIK